MAGDFEPRSFRTDSHDSTPYQTDWLPRNMMMTNRRRRPLDAFLLVAMLLVTGFLVGTPNQAVGLELETEVVREYTAPVGFKLKGFLARGVGADTAIAGNFKPPAKEGGPQACYVIIADAEGASGFEVRYQSSATECSGLTPRPGGGFFLRGNQKMTQSGTASGFTMKLSAEGNVQWTTDDGPIAEAQDFRGMYARPASPLAYNPRSEYLMSFTLAAITIGGQSRKVTHGSVLRNDSGAFQTKAIRLGNSQGFGIVGGVEPMPDSGDFLIFIFNPATDGAEFFTYDGRQSVDEFKPRGEGWSDRTVVQMRVGPDGLVYLVWVDATADKPATKVTAVSTSGAEIWSGEYAADATVGGESQSLEAPAGMWVGSENVLIFYNSGHLRAIDSGNGQGRGVVPLSGASGDNFQPADIIHGDGGRLKLLAISTKGDAPKFRELSLSFSGTNNPTGDAGIGDASPSGGSGDASSDSACSTYRPSSAPGRGLLAMLGVISLFAYRRRRRG